MSLQKIPSSYLTNLLNLNSSKIECWGPYMSGQKQGKSIVFDLGGVFIDWNSLYLYQKIFNDPTELNYFLKKVCPLDWNLELDRGMSFEQGVRWRSQLFPHYREAIEAYHTRWPEMIAAEIGESTRILRYLRDQGIPFWGITNFNGEKLNLCREKFEWLAWFEGLIVSGREYMTKPDPRIYQLLGHRYQLKLKNCFFTDDSLINVIGAQKVGMDAYHFQSSSGLIEAMKIRNLLPLQF